MDKSDQELWGIDKRKEAEAQEAYANDAYDIDVMLKQAFSRGSGKKALQYMTDFSNQFACDPSLGFEKGAAYGFFAEGIKQLVWDIKQRMDRSNQGPPKSAAGEDK